MRNYNLKIDPVNKPLQQLPHPGLGKLGYKENLDLNRDWDDEEKRTKGGDISPKNFSTHAPVKEKYIPDEDMTNAEFEEKDIMAIQRNDLSVRPKEIPLEVFGQDLPKCKKVKCIKASGCVCVVAITAGNATKDVYSVLQKKIRPRVKIGG